MTKKKIIISTSLADALSLPLMFHAGGVWTPALQKEWERITGSQVATSGVMCQHIRTVLKLYQEKQNDGHD